MTVVICNQVITKGSSFIIYLLKKTICIAMEIAQKKVSRSPMLKPASVKPVKKYIPIKAKKTPNQELKVGICFKTKIERIGTIITDNPVIKPEREAVVNCSP